MPIVTRRPREWRRAPGYDHTRLYSSKTQVEEIVDNSSTYIYHSSDLAALAAIARAQHLARQVDAILGCPSDDGSSSFSRGKGPSEDRRPPIFETDDDSWTYARGPIRDSDLETDAGKLLQDYSLDDFEQDFAQPDRHSDTTLPNPSPTPDIRWQ